MRNILDDKPTVDLHGRNAYTMRFVGDADLQEKDVLEIGSGSGSSLNALPRGVGRLTGVEPTDGDLSTARKYVVAPNVQFQLGSALRLPFPDATFDTVVCWEVMEHLPKQSEPTMFAEVGRDYSRQRGLLSVDAVRLRAQHHVDRCPPTRSATVTTAWVTSRRWLGEPPWWSPRSRSRAAGGDRVLEPPRLQMGAAQGTGLRPNLPGADR